MSVCAFESVRGREKRVLPAALLLMPLFDSTVQVCVCVCVSRAALRQAVIDGVC